MVKTGVTSEDKVQILSGLKAGDTVVVDGADRLREGAHVRVTADSANPSSNVNPGPGAPPGQQPAASTPRRLPIAGITRSRQPRTVPRLPAARAPGGR